MTCIKARRPPWCVSKCEEMQGFMWFAMSVFLFSDSSFGLLSDIQLDFVCKILGVVLNFKAFRDVGENRPGTEKDAAVSNQSHHSSFLGRHLITSRHLIKMIQRMIGSNLLANSTQPCHRLQDAVNNLKGSLMDS